MDQHPIKFAFQKCFYLRGVTYLPHYVEDCFVGPGWSHKTGSGDNVTYHPNKYSAQRLIDAGAESCEMYLWERKKHG